MLKRLFQWICAGIERFSESPAGFRCLTADLPAEGPAGKSEKSSVSSFRGDAEDLLFGAGSAKAGALFRTPGIILFSISEELQKKRIICCIGGKKQV